MPLDHVVRSLLERTHPRHGVCARLREEDHGHVAIPAATGLSLAEAAAELRLRRDHDVRSGTLGEVERPRAPRRLEHPEAVVAQVPLEVAPRLRLGLGEKDGARRHDVEARAARTPSRQMSIRPVV